MRELFLSVLSMSLAGGAAYMLLKLLSHLGGDRLTQRWRYTATALVAALFLLPIHRLWSALPGRPRVVVLIPAGALSAPRPAVPAAVYGRYIDLAAAVWLAVAAVLTLTDTVKAMRCRRLLMTGAKEAGERERMAAEDAANTAGVRQRARIYVSPVVLSPMLVGFFTPVILLPERELSQGELRLIITHELIHFRRLDLWRKLAFGVIRSVHWFNPAAYLMCRDMSALMETSCDERVVSGLDRDGRREYGYLLIDCAPATRREGAFVSFASCREKLERRIETMMESKKRSHVIFGLLLALILAVGCVATTALAAGSEPVEVKVIDCTDTEAVATGEIADVKVATVDGKTGAVWYDTVTGEQVETVTYEINNGCIADIISGGDLKVSVGFIDLDESDLQEIDSGSIVINYEAK